MKHLVRTALIAGAVASATPALAVDIIVVSHGQANDPFWSVVKNGVDKAAEDTGATVDYRLPKRLTWWS
jgi:simple sugar transport system substrate-binding protein